jgi:hypothetical protein
MFPEPFICIFNQKEIAILTIKLYFYCSSSNYHLRLFSVSFLICSFTIIKRATFFQSSSTGSIFNTNKMNSMNQKTLKTLRTNYVLSHVVALVISFRQTQRQDKFTPEQIIIIGDHKIK